MTQFQIGQNTYLSTEFYQPLEESGRWFVSPYALAGQQTRGVFSGDDKIADYRIGSGQVGLDGGAVLGTWGQLRVGPCGRTSTRASTRARRCCRRSTRTRPAFARELFVDQFNHAWFPTDGVSRDGSRPTRR